MSRVGIYYARGSQIYYSPVTIIATKNKNKKNSAAASRIEYYKRILYMYVYALV